MNELIIVDSNGRKGIDSRQVAEMVGKDHSNLLRDIRGYIDVINSPDSKLKAGDFFIDHFYFDKQGQERTGYLISKMGCDMVANKLTGEKGIMFTAAYVDKFNKMETGLIQLPDFTNPAIAARAWADEVEAKMLAQAEVKELQPKGEFYDAIADDSGAYWSLRDAPKAYPLPGLTESWFRKSCRAEGWIAKDSNKVTEIGRRGGYMRYVTEYKNGMKYDVPVLLGRGFDYMIKKFKHQQNKGLF